LPRSAAWRRHRSTRSRSACPRCGFIGCGNGRLPAGGAIVARPRTRSLLCATLAPQPQRDTLGPCVASSGQLLADRARQRMEAASGVVRQQIPFFGPPEGGVSRRFHDGGLVASSSYTTTEGIIPLSAESLQSQNSRTISVETTFR
jgi:hypothetical protein